MPNIDNPIARYLGEYITCFPSSNAVDDGKLQLEFNQARYVTRVSSKNFCVVKPSFEPSIYVDVETGLPQIKFTPGQASINGMDLIMTSDIYINPPKDKGHYYLAFKLARDSSSNVLGDLVYGATTTFEGVYLTYYDKKPDPLTDMDMLYLAEIDWDGNTFTNVVEDEDKYGRLWAEDILGKFLDPKHPDIRRLNLQEFIYKIPDWYFSKEGDTIYGPVSIADNRDNNNPGILVNVDETGSHITIKEPTKDNNLLQFYGDLNRDGVIDNKDLQIIKDIISGKIVPTPLQEHLADVNHDGVIDNKDLQYIQNFIAKNDGNYGDTGNIYFIDNSSNQVNIITSKDDIIAELGNATIKTSKVDDKLHIHNEGDICIDGEGEVKIEGDNKISLSTETANSPVLALDNNNVSITSPAAPNLKFDFTFLNANTAQQTVGKALWQYNYSNKKISLLETDVSYLDIKPNTDMNKSLRVKDTIYIGSETVYGNEKTYLKKLNWRITDNTNTNYIDVTPKIIKVLSANADGSSYAILGNSTSTKYSRINDNGTIELVNNAANTTITFKDGTVANNVTVSKILNSKVLRIDGELQTSNNIISDQKVIGKTGLETQNGVLTFVRGTNNATITKDNNSSALRTNGNLYVGSSGQSQLYAGNTIINGSFAVGGNSYTNSELKIDASGNLDTSGTITGSKVYNAVYNGFGEIFEKDENENIDYGYLVCVREDGLVHKVSSTSDYTSIVGICSDTIGIEMSGDTKNLPKNKKLSVEMLGKIWVNTDDINITPGKMIEATPDGKVKVCYDAKSKIGVALTKVIDGKVKIVFHGC